MTSTGMSFPWFFTYTKPYVAAASTSCLATSACGMDPEISITGICPAEVGVFPFEVAIS